MIEKRNYSLYNVTLTGLPRKYNNKQKITFDKSFNILIDNLQVLFNFEISKYILFKIHSDVLLNRIINTLSQDNLNINVFKQYFNLWFVIYNKFSYIIDKNKIEAFNEEIKKTQFYSKHSNMNLQYIITNLIKDLDQIDNKNLLMLIEIKEESLKILKLILKYSCKINKNIIVNGIDDLVIDNLNEFDIGYRGSFLKIWKKYYESNPKNNEIIKKYDLKLILEELVQRMSDYYTQLLIKIKSKYPDYEIEFTRNFLSEIINIMFDFYIHLGMEMAEEYAINKCFGQSSKMHFKTLFVSLKRLIVKNESFNESQLLLMHYTLLTSEKLIKFIVEPMKDDADDK